MSLEEKNYEKIVMQIKIIKMIKMINLIKDYQDFQDYCDDQYLTRVSLLCLSRYIIPALLFTAVQIDLGLETATSKMAVSDCVW